MVQNQQNTPLRQRLTQVWLPLFRRYLAPGGSSVSMAELVRSAGAAWLALAVTAVVSAAIWHDPLMPLLVSPVAASCVILFALPHSPLGQPWPFVAGNLLSAVVGLVMAALVAWCFPCLEGGPWLAAVLAVPTAILAMGLLRCIHPPAGAQALLYALASQAWQQYGALTALAPLMLNLALLLLMVLILNNFLPGRSYPARGAKPADATIKPSALMRTGLQHEDLRAAMISLDTLLDVSEQDLVELYHRANRHAFERQCGLTVGQIMTRDVVALDFATPLEEAWNTLRLKEIKALPVIDRSRRVVGVVTRMDFLRHCDNRNLDQVRTGLAMLLSRRQQSHDDLPQVVGQIMAPKVFVVEESMPVTALLERLTHGGRHHVPVVDARRRLVGMVTQSDLLAALFQQLALGDSRG